MSAAAPPAAAEAAWPRPAYSWYVLSVICFAYMFAFVDRTILGMLTPAIQADLGITDTQIGLLQGIAFAASYTLFGLPVGWAVDRFHRTRILTAGVTVWSVMTALCGLAGGFWPLFFARTGVGIGESTVNPCASSIISDYFPPSRRAFAFGFYVMSTAVAGIVTGLFGAAVLSMMAGYDTIHIPLLGELKPWQATFILVGTIGVAPALAMQLTVKEPLRREVVAVVGKAGRAQTLAFMKRNARTLVCVLLGASLILFEIYGTLYWQPSLFLRKFGWAPQKTAAYLATFGAPVGVISAFTSGIVTTWFKKRGHADGALLTCLIGAVGCTVLGALAPLSPTPQIAIALFALKSFVINYPSAAALTAINEMTPNQYRGQVTACYVVLTGLVAQGIGPVAVGLTTDYVFGSQAAVGESLALVVVVTGVAGSALLLLGRKAYRRSMAEVQGHAPPPHA